MLSSQARPLCGWLLRVENDPLPFGVNSKDRKMGRMWILANAPHSSLDAKFENLGVSIDCLLSWRVSVVRVWSPDRKSTFSVGVYLFIYLFMSSSLWNSATLSLQIDERTGIVLSHSSGENRIHDDINLETFTLISTFQLVCCQGNHLVFCFFFQFVSLAYSAIYYIYLVCTMPTLPPIDQAFDGNLVCIQFLVFLLSFFLLEGGICLCSRDGRQTTT